MCLMILILSLRLNHVQKVELTWGWIKLVYLHEVVLVSSLVSKLIPQGRWQTNCVTVRQSLTHDATPITCVASLEIHFNSAEYSLRFPHFPFFGAYRSSQMLLYGEQLKRNTTQWITRWTTRLLIVMSNDRGVFVSSFSKQQKVAQTSSLLNNSDVIASRENCFTCSIITFYAAGVVWQATKYCLLKCNSSKTWQ